MHTDLDRGDSLAQLLRELPAEGAQPFGWDEFRRRSQPRVTLASRLAGGPALAATVVIAVAACALAIRIGGFAHHPHATTPMEHGVATLSPQEPLPPGPANEITAERYLASLPHEPALVHVGTRAAVETLEDDIAQVDDMVSGARAGTPPARLQALLDQRTRLVSSLVQVRYAETLADASR